MWKRVRLSRLLKSPVTRTLILVVIVDLFILLLVAVSINSGLRMHEERAAISARNLNLLVTQDIAGEMDRIDSALQDLSEEFTAGMAGSPVEPGRAVQVLARWTPRLPMAVVLGFSDARGRMLATSETASPGQDISDRDYFRRLQDNPAQGMIISPPLQGKVSGKWALVMARAVRDGKGRLLGVVTVSVSIDWFLHKFENLEVGPHGAVVLRGDASRDFDLLVRYPAAGFVGQTKVSDTFRATIAADPRQGSYEAHAGADGILRRFSYRAVGDYPLITLVGLAPEDFLTAWRQDAMKLYGLGLAFVLLSAAGGYALIRSWRRLEQRSAELERSNTDLEQFAFVASHDLQTPLRAVASYAQLLERGYKGRLDAEADQYIGFLVDSAKRMSMLIRDLLDYSRVPMVGKSVGVSDLSNVARWAYEQLKSQFDEIGAQVEISGLPVVQADKIWMESLFLHLLENALRYRDTDHPLRVRLHACEDERSGWWRITCSDNGIGIDPCHHEKIFLIFQRLARDRFPEGTGIGLAYCRRLVSRYGGRMWVESELGQGARFHVTLPGEQAAH